MIKENNKTFGYFTKIPRWRLLILENGTDKVVQMCVDRIVAVVAVFNVVPYMRHTVFGE